MSVIRRTGGGARVPAQRTRGLFLSPVLGIDEADDTVYRRARLSFFNFFSLTLTQKRGRFWHLLADHLVRSTSLGSLIKSNEAPVSSRFRANCFTM